MSTPINWKVSHGNPVLNHPVYQKYSAMSFEDMSATDVKNSLKLALASNESADLISYLSWILRVLALVA